MATQKLWGGRFSGAQHSAFDTFNASIGLDAYLVQVDIEGSKAHAMGLEAIGLLSSDELYKVQTALDVIAKEVAAGTCVPLDSDEDVHMWVERVLTESLGSLGKKIHTGRSRNDQVATDMKLWLMKELKNHKEAIYALVGALYNQAQVHQKTLMPGYTHLQQAQPVSLAFHLLTYMQMLMRDVQKADQLLENLDAMPLGSGALAGVSYPIDRELVAKALGFSKVVPHAMDAVSDRDYVSDYLFWVAQVLSHLSRLSEELILWSSQQFQFVTLGDDVTSGSSIMPQKKNPDACELIRGKAGVAMGRVSAMLAVIKGLPLAYNKDLQEDKELIFLAHRDLSQSVQVMTLMMAGAQFHETAMKNALKRGYVNATDLADYLVGKGVPFRDAHHSCGQLVSLAISKGVALEELSLEEFKSVSPLIDDAVYTVLDYYMCTEKKTSRGSTKASEVALMLDAVSSWLAS
jgi:argininosuccinate lyase